MKFKLQFCLVVSLLSSIAAQSYGTPISAAEVAKHGANSDCWIIIDGKIYDVTDYINKHPAPRETLEGACGKDATEGWKTKGSVNKPHSKKAAVLLRTLLKGELDAGISK